MSRTEVSTPAALGFTLLELLVSMVAVTTMMAGIIRLFVLQHRTHAQQEQSITTEENIRLASAMITDALRDARYAAPSGDAVVTNVFPALTTNPWIPATQDSVSVAACFKEPVAHLNAQAIKNVTSTLSLDASVTGVLDTANQSLIRIGESDIAKVTSIAGSSITIDTLPPTSRPVQNDHPPGANICRVDLVTFNLANNQLLRNENQSGTQVVADNITSLNISLTPPKTYVVTLTGRSPGSDPVSGGTAAIHTLKTTVTVRN